LADAFHAERVARRGCLGAPEDEIWDVRRTRDRVIHELSREQLTALVVNGLLHERRTDRLSYPALHLTFDQKRVYLLAAVVDRNVFQDLHLTRVAVYLDRDDVRPER